MSGWKILGAIVALAVTAVVAVGVLMYFRVVPIPGPIVAFLVGAKEPEYSARFYPPDTIAYAWVTLAPGSGQLNDMQDIWARINEFRDFRRFVDELQDQFEDETGIDFETELAPWIGPDASSAFIDYDARRNEVIAAATISVRDADAARNFLDQWLEYMEDTEGANFDSDSYKDFRLWVDEGEYQVYGLSKDLLVFATTESGFREVADAILGDTNRSLADTEKFQAARAALPQRRFASAFLDYQEALNLAEDLEIDEFGFMGVGQFDEQEPEWIAASAAWHDRAIAIETVMPIGIEQPLAFTNLSDPSDRLQYDTLAFVAQTFDPNVDHWRQAMSDYRITDFLTSEMVREINQGIDELNYDVDVLNLPDLNENSTLADVLDLAFDFIDGLIGIHLEEDLLDYLSGEMVLALADFSFTAVEEDPLNTPVEVLAMLSYRDANREQLADTMDDVADLIEENLFLFVDIDSVDVGADDDATIFAIRSELAQTAYAPGYVIHGGYITIGSTNDALETAVALQSGGGNNLASYDEYQRAIENLPTERQFLGFVNLRRIVRQLEPADLDMTSEEFQILEAGLGVMAMSSYSPHCLDASAGYSCTIPGGTDVTRITAVLTLFPE